MAEFIQEVPKVGSRFRNPEEAWQYWVTYGGRVGFDVRKRYTNKSNFDRKVTSCRYVCSNEGHRRKGASDHVTKCFRAETRTDCKARMTLTLDRGEDNYEVTDVVLEHNHLLRLPEAYKSTKSSVPTKKIAKQQKKKGGTKPLVELEHDANNKGVELQEYAVIGNFTQLIAAPTLANVELPDVF